MELIDCAHKFKYFVNVVETGSISAGASKSFLSQPQMTKVIRQLEEVLEATLLIRSKSGVELTSDGATLYEHAKSLIDSTNTIDLLLRNQIKLKGGKIKIGTYDSIGRYFFPDFLRYLNKINPSLKVSMETNKSAILCNKLNNKELDLVIVVDAKGVSSATIENIYTDTFQFYSSSQSNHEFSNRIIYYSGIKGSIKSILRSKAFSESIECDNIETVRSLTEEGLGVGILPSKVAREGIVKGKLVQQSGPHSKGLYEHSIDICTATAENRQIVSFFKNEVKRFLKVWSGS